LLDRQGVDGADALLHDGATLIVCLDNYDQLGVPRHRDVGIVGGDQELAALFFSAQSLDDLVKNELVVEIVFRIDLPLRRKLLLQNPHYGSVEGVLEIGVGCVKLV
jgi:hypothetical protein